MDSPQLYQTVESLHRQLIYIQSICQSLRGNLSSQLCNPDSLPNNTEEFGRLLQNLLEVVDVHIKQTVSNKLNDLVNSLNNAKLENELKKC